MVGKLKCVISELRCLRKQKILRHIGELLILDERKEENKIAIHLKTTRK